MARINFDDDVEKQDEFWALFELVGRDRDKALGMLVRFFRLSQKAYGQGEGLTEEELKKSGLEFMIQSGWAVTIPEAPHLYEAKGATKHFAWYHQKCEAAMSGGRARSAAKRNEKGQYLPAEIQPEASRDPAGSQPASSPLSLAPSLSLSLSKYKEEEKKVFVESPSAPPNPKRDEFDLAKSQWLKTLAHFKAPRGELLPHEEREIWRALKANNLVMVCNALAGMRLEKATERFNPADHLDIYRAFKPDRMGVFINLAVQETERRAKLRVQPPPPQLHSFTGIGSIMQGINSGVTA